MLQNFISHISHTGLIHAHIGDDFGILMCFSSDGRDDFFSLVQTQIADHLLCFDRCLDGVIHVLKNTVHPFHRTGYLHIRHDFLYNVMNHAFI